MKTLAILLLPFLLSTPLNAPKATSFQGKAFAPEEKLDFTDSTKEEVDSYYADVDTSLSGESFRESLYDVISVDNTFVTYQDVTDWYKITDRNWELSQEIDPDTYTFEKDYGDNYYLVQLYSSGNDDPKKAYNTDANGNSWTKDETIDHIDYDDRIKNNGNIQIDKEHVWAKSHGFAPDDGDPEKGAGTDLHHLMAADHYTNSSGHNNLDFGIVADKEAYSTKVIHSYNADGTSDISGYRGKNEEGVTVFEPMDEWKGDIARALFYMATRYGIDRGEENTQEEPYLFITDDWSATDDNEHWTGVQHGLSVFLEWNELDPVDSYEKKRNDLIDKNVQNNRNPFVDHPEWVDRAFDPEFTALPSLDDLSESYYLYVGDVKALDVDLPEDATYSLEVTLDNEDVLTLSEDKKTVTAKKAGECLVTYKVSYKDSSTGEEVLQQKSTRVVVKDLPKILQADGTTPPSTIAIPFLGSYETSFHLDGGYGETIVLSSSDESVVAIEDNILRGLSFGEATITLSIVHDGKSVALFSFVAKVELTKPILIAFVIAIAVILLLIILVLVLRHRKKKKKKNNKKK